MGKATVIKADGTTLELDHRPTLKEAQTIVGGYIELLKLKGTRLTVVADEEGKIKNYPRNWRASGLFKPWELVGDVIILEGWRTVGS